MLFQLEMDIFVDTELSTMKKLFLIVMADLLAIPGRAQEGGRNQFLGLAPFNGLVVDESTANYNLWGSPLELRFGPKLKKVQKK